MFKKILIGLAVLVAGIIVAALLKSPDFRVERSLVIAAPAEKLFPWFDNHRKFAQREILGGWLQACLRSSCPR